ncbi:neurofilament heavy polypeptide-like [Dermacentor albipictus]|uniref:neurofilament heavy polypeptide-like n=1 Tax=Dermacentor albipictus TaxID=60249 RepID=UPI0038FCC6B4
MTTPKRDEVQSSNPETTLVEDHQTSEEAGQVAVSSPPDVGSTRNAGSSANAAAASSVGSEESRAAGGRGSPPPATVPSDATRRGSSAPSRPSGNTHESTTAKSARAKARPSMSSVRKPDAADRRTSKASVSPKASSRTPGTWLHKASSLSSVPTTVSTSTSPIGSVELTHPPHHFHAATQNQLTPELCPASPVPEKETRVASERPGTKERSVKDQLSGRSSAGVEPPSESKEDQDKKERKKEAHLEGEEEALEKTEAKEKPEEIKSPVAKKPRKKPPRGFKMPDGTYVGLSEKNRYLKAMYKEHLKCDYVPFCILGVLMVVVIALVYLYAFRPDIFNRFIEAIRNLLGLNKKDEDQEDTGSIHIMPPNSSLKQGAWSSPEENARPSTTSPANESSLQMRIL